MTITAYAVGSWIWAAGNCLNQISLPIEYWWRVGSACALAGAAISCIAARLNRSPEAYSWASLLAILAGSLAQPSGESDPSPAGFARVALAGAILAMHGREWQTASWWLLVGPVALLAGASSWWVDAASIGLSVAAAVAMLTGGRLPLLIERAIAACAVAPFLTLCIIAIDDARIDLVTQAIVYLPVIALAFIGAGRSAVAVPQS